MIHATELSYPLGFCHRFDLEVIPIKNLTLELFEHFCTQDESLRKERFSKLVAQVLSTERLEETEGIPMITIPQEKPLSSPSEMF